MKLTTATFLAGVMFLLYTWVSTPRVYFSNITGECVAVYPRDAGTCKNLPEKYESRWAQ